MRHLHIIRAAGDHLAIDVVRRQLAAGDEVRVVVAGAAAQTEVPAGADRIPMPTLQYDQLVELLDWCERVVSW